MKLKTVEITEFQSIWNSTAFDIGDITCLVGKNEAGKTAILKALYRLNPIIPNEGKFDITDDYPRSEVQDYLQDVESARRKPARVVKVTFNLAEEELKSIESELGKGILRKPELVLSKGYENTIFVSLDPDEKVAVQSAITTAQLPKELAIELLKSSNIQSLRSSMITKTDPQSAEHLARLKDILDKITNPSDLPLYIYNKYLQKNVPKFLYFDEYFMMKGQENIEALKSRQEQNKLNPSDYPLLGLIELARLKLTELLNPNRTEELISKLEGAGNHLSKKILKYWSQNTHIQMAFDVRAARPGDPQEMRNGTNIWARVHDSKRMVSTPLGTRSRGFVWFFSFLAWFDQKQHEDIPLILLLDEPGLFLHGRAQGDLLRFMEEELKGGHQVIYTTHSPFMVDPTKFARVRIVQDKSMDTDRKTTRDQEGTKVITEVLEATEDSLFPLQGALGYDICQTLFIGPNSLIVEGVSDLLYLQTISALLESLGRTNLSGKWVITPVGGTDKVPTFVALLGAQHGFTVAALIDLQTKDTQTIENLYKKKLLKKQNVLTYANFTKTKEADIEDMFGVDFYLELVNAEYARDLTSPITINMLKVTNTRIVPKFEAVFPTVASNKKYHFSHYRPARYFAENITKLTKKIPDYTLDRFEEAFKALNALL